MDNYNNVEYTNSEKSWESANTGVQHLALAVLEWGPGEHTDNNKHDRLLETFFRGDTKTITQWHVEHAYGYSEYKCLEIILTVRRSTWLF